MTEVFDYLDNILDGVEKIKRDIRELTYEEFGNDPKTGETVTAVFCHLPPRSLRRECQHDFILS